MQGAKSRVVIQSPYLVMSEPALELFRGLTARGVSVRINTNSLASTDNLPAFSGYRNQRARLLDMGLQVYEYRPDPPSGPCSRIRARRWPLTPSPSSRIG